MVSLVMVFLAQTPRLQLAAEFGGRVILSTRNTAPFETGDARVRRN